MTHEQNDGGGEPRQIYMGEEDAMGQAGSSPRSRGLKRGRSRTLKRSLSRWARSGTSPVKDRDVPPLAIAMLVCGTRGDVQVWPNASTLHCVRTNCE